MSKENAKKFLDAMKDKADREAWNAKVAGVKNDEEALEAAIDMAKEMGYDVTKEELTDTLKELKAEQKEKTKKAVQGVQELDLDDLEDVAGGYYYFEFVTGKGCQGGLYERKEGGCKKEFDDTTCFQIDACSFASIYYYDCPGEYFENGAENDCWGMMY
jgi:uncharacterized protein YwqG